MRRDGGAMRGASAAAWRVDAAQLVDAVAVVALCLLALLGLGSTYGGLAYLVSGGVGVVAGVLLGHLGARLRVPLLGVAAAMVAVYFVVGLAVPGPRSVTGLARLTVHGWKQVLTTLPPLGSSGPLLGIPFLLGLVAATLAASLASRTRPSFAPLAGPAALFAAVILLGRSQPTRWLLGVGFVALALGWAALRHQRTRPVVRHGARQTTRAALAVGMLVVAGAGAAAIGPGLPLRQARDRVVLRNYVHPPFDVRDYPSPLAGFRKYTKNGALNDKLLFTATGLPDGVPVKIATLDSYDGLVWGAGDPDATTASLDSFQRVGTTIATTARGATATVTVRIGPDYDDVWVPTAGQLTAIRFTGQHRSAFADAFRYNVGTATGVLPQQLTDGDSYTLRAVVPPTVDLSALSPYGTPSLSANYTAFLRSAVTQWSNGVSGGWAQLAAIAKHLHDDGKYSDGAGDESIYLPGHSVGRLAGFLSGRQLVGDDEQYAALFALMADALGFPARVVLGAVPEAGGVVKGKDVHAWVELQVGDGQWATVPTNEFMPDTDKHPDKLPPQQQQDSPASVVPPPNAVHPPSSLTSPDQSDTRVDRRDQSHHTGAGGGFHLPRFVVVAATYGGPPALAIALVCAAIVGLKLLRRRRRRLRGQPATRVAAGWRELVDHARDLGAVVPGGQTRHEEAVLLASHGVAPLAASADAVVFGPGLPPPEAASWYWSEVERMRRQMSRGVGRWRRLRAAVSLRSLRRPARIMPDARPEPALPRG